MTSQWKPSIKRNPINCIKQVHGFWAKRRIQDHSRWKQRSKFTSPWLTPAGLLKSIKRKNGLYKQLITSTNKSCELQCKAYKNKLNHLCIVQFDPLPSPPGNPRNKFSPSGTGVGNCLKRSCLRVGVGASHKYLAKYMSFFALFVRWLQTSGLRVFKGKHRNLSESGCRGVTYQHLSRYLKVCPSRSHSRSFIFYTLHKRSS